MEIKKKYIKLQDLEVYQLAMELSKIGWGIYNPLDWQTKKIMGDQLFLSPFGEIPAEFFLFDPVVKF